METGERAADRELWITAGVADREVWKTAREADGQLKDTEKHF